MYKQGNPLRKISLSRHAIHVAYRWVALPVIAACPLAPCAVAQGNEDVPTIRVETQEVLIPTIVTVYVADQGGSAIRSRGYYDVLHLGASDFHLFEDGKEQTINSVALARPYSTGLQRDNLGYQFGDALSPRGEWKNLRASPINLDLSDALYMIGYKPALSPDESCHTIRISVADKDASGHRMTKADSSGLFGNAVKTVKRSQLILRYRNQFCNVAHPSYDPLYGTPVSRELENLVAEDKAEQDGFYLSAFDLFDESGKPRVHVALDYSDLADKPTAAPFPVALIGTFNQTKGALAARFSDGQGEAVGCYLPGSKPTTEAKFPCYRDRFDNHYETEVDLPPGDYDLRVGIDFGGALRRAETRVTIGPRAQRLAVGGIALCRRYLPHNPIPFGLRLPTDDIPTVPFDLKPLVSKGFEFTPTGDAHFKATDFMAVYFEVFEPLLEDALLLPDGDKVRVQFEMRVVDAKTGEVKSDTGFRPADGFVNPDQVVIPINEQVAIGGLNPGDYQLQVRATDSAGNLTDWRSTSFTRE
jgi:hypothetical protein